MLYNNIVIIRFIIYPYIINRIMSIDSVTLIDYFGVRYNLTNISIIDTIYSLKTQIKALTGVNEDTQFLSTIDATTGVISASLEDSKTIGFYNIQNDSTLLLNGLELYNSDLSHRTPLVLNDSTRILTDVNNLVGWPYSPYILRNTYKSTPVSPIPNKKQVVITIVNDIAMPKLYLQSCMDLFCDEYSLPRTELEVIPLFPESLNLVNALLINSLTAYIDTLNGGHFNSNDYINYSSPINESDTPMEKSIRSLLIKMSLQYLESLFETLLDSQWSYAMNTNAHIRIVQAKSPSFNELCDAVSYASNPINFIGNKWGPTDIINMSWGKNDDNHLTSTIINECEKSFVNNKICYLASTGDHYIVGYPSTSANVLGVGGTSLYNNISNQITQTFWNNNNGNGGGCGPSINTPKPSYQSNVNELNSFTTKCSPDISSLADPNTGVVIIFAGSTISNKSFEFYGGTSLSSPLNAGMLSNLIQTSINNNGPSFTTIVNHGDSILLQDVLYTIYDNPKLYSECFYDIVLGGVNQYQAKVGFDVPTGLGIPLWNNITELLFPTLSSNICFPNNTPISTDQGIVNIEDIDIEKHTIKNSKIVAVTKSIHNDDYLVCFLKDCIGKNIPSQNTITSSRHKVYYKNNMIEARKIASINKNVTKIKYNKSILYNILLDKHSVIHVNNMVCETLHPNNIIAKLYTRFTDKQARDEIIYKLNKYIKNKDYVSYKNIIYRIENGHM